MQYSAQSVTLAEDLTRDPEVPERCNTALIQYARTFNSN